MDWTPRLVSVRFEDSAGLGMTIGPGDGNLQISGDSYGFAESLKVSNRGGHDGFNKGPDRVLELSITVRQLATSITHASESRVRDFVKKAGAFASAQSVDNTIWAWRCILTYDDGAGITSTVTHSVCEGEIAEAHGFPSNTYAITFRSHVAPTVA